MLHLLFNLILFIMAIVNSLAIGKSIKSAGNLTYKTVRGRTIASQRITQNKSNTPFQQDQRMHFANVSTSMKLIQQYIDICFEKSKYGSSRNAFFSLNKRFTLGGLVGEVQEGIVKFSDAMLSALATEPLRQLSFLSSGSLAGFLSINYKGVASYKYGENTYNNLRVITDGQTDTYSTGSYDFQFATPVKKSDLRLYFFGFADNGLITGVGTTEGGSPTFSFSDSNLAEATTSSKAYSSDDSGIYCRSVHVEVTLSNLASCPVAVVVPVVSGKVVSITGVFAKQSAV